MNVTYKDHLIALTDDYEFRVSGPLVEDGNRRSYDSMWSAKESVDKLIADKARQERVKLAIPMLDDDGNDVTITGLHGGHGKMLGIGNKTSYVYPPVPWVREALREHKRLSEQASQLYRRTRSLAIQTQPYGRTFEDKVVRMQADIAEAIEKAQRARIVEAS